MNKKPQTTTFIRILQNIKDELDEGNPQFTKIIEEALNKDGTLALKVAFGEQLKTNTLTSGKEDKKPPPSVIY